MKQCTKCKVVKPLTDFTRRRIYPDGLDQRCRVCKNANKRAWGQKNKDRVKVYNKETRFKYPYSLSDFRRRKYGLTLEAFQEMLLEQDYKCYLCRESLELTGRVCVDHDYETNKVRKILCIKCNTGLGMFNESAEALRNAAKYLDNH